MEFNRLIGLQKRRITVALCMILVCILSFVSCAHFQGIDGSGKDIVNSYTNGSIRFNDSNGDELETVVKNVYVFLFRIVDSDSKGNKNILDTAPIYIEKNSSDKFTFNVKPNFEYNVIIVANAKEAVEKAISSGKIKQGLTKAEIIKSIILDRGDDFSWGDADSFPMYGERSSVRFVNNAQPISFKLLRAVSKFYFSSANLSDIGYIKHVYVHNFAPSCQIIPNEDCVDKDADGQPTKVIKASPTGQQSSAFFPFEMGMSDQYVTFYGFDTPDNSSDMSKAPCLILDFSYFDEDMHSRYYRIDFIKDGKLLNPMRGNFYTLKLKSIQQHGAATLEEAAATANTDVSTSVVNYVEDDMRDIVLPQGEDAQVDFDTRELYFKSNASSQSVHITTNPSLWTFTGFTHIPWAPMPPEGQFSFEKIGDGTAKFSCKENTSGTNYGALANLKCGVLSFTVSVLQQK